MRPSIHESTSGVWWLLLGAVATLAGCSSSEDGYNSEIAGNSATSTSGGGGGSAMAAATTDAGSSTNPTVTTGQVGVIFGSGDPEGGGDTGMSCAAIDAPTTLQEVVLAFVFDVSASMGNESLPYFSRALKWDPVVAATKAFFADPDSSGLSATLTFFPNELAAIASAGGGFAGGGGPGGGGMGGPECDAGEYATPDVPLTPLPSDAFAAAIDAVTPPDADSWRLGTPTLAALQGTYTAIDTMRTQNPNSRYTVVLVTDGMPALCPNPQADSVTDVADAAAAVAATTPTYVIGVANPVTADEPDPPDSVSGLNEVAQAGGTQSAFLVDTSNPTQTAEELKTIIEQIRESSFSCSVSIPPPPGGEVFDQTKVNVQYSSTATGPVDYAYDPTCAAPNAWHYDDEANPTTIEVCPTVCDSLRASPDGQLNVQFGCQTRIK